MYIVQDKQVAVIQHSRTMMEKLIALCPDEKLASEAKELLNHLIVAIHSMREI